MQQCIVQNTQSSVFGLNFTTSLAADQAYTGKLITNALNGTSLPHFWGRLHRESIYRGSHSTFPPSREWVRWGARGFLPSKSHILNAPRGAFASITAESCSADVGMRVGKSL